LSAGFRFAKNEDEEAEPPNDLVHCVCGSEVDEGFMIQVGVTGLWVWLSRSSYCRGYADESSQAHAFVVQGSGRDSSNNFIGRKYY